MPADPGVPGGATALGGPGRRLVVGSVAGALAGGAVLGLIVGVVFPPDPPDPTVKLAVAASGAAPTATAAVQAAPAAPAPRVSPSPSASLRTSQQAEVTAPADLIQRPASDRTLRLYRLDDLWHNDEGRIVLKVTPLLSEGRARAGEGSFELKLREDATIFGTYYLGDGENVQPNRFSPDDAYNRLREVLDRGDRPLLWIKRKFIADGSAVYVAEQAPSKRR